jgi:hypothetical protein
MHKRTAMELYETKRILTRNNQTNRFKTTTKNMSKMLKISPSKARKFIELLEDEKFLVCENKPKQIGRGAWSKYEIHIINPLDINVAKKHIDVQKNFRCESCKYGTLAGYFNDVKGEVKTKCRSYYCNLLCDKVSGIEDCIDYKKK